MSDESFSSNIDDLARWERELIDTWDFTVAGESQSLGRDMVGAVAEGINERTVADQKDATGGDLTPNEARYAARKAREWGSHQPLIRSGQMLSLESLIGEVEVEPHQITMRYGTGRPATRVSGPGGKLRDDEPTDREKAGWNSEERPFYALDEAIVDDHVMPVAAESFDKHLKAKGGS